MEASNSSFSMTYVMILFSLTIIVSLCYRGRKTSLNPPAQPRRPRQGYGRRRGNGGAGPGWCITLRVSDDDAYISLTIFLVYAHLNSQVYYFVNRDSVRLNSSLAL